MFRWWFGCANSIIIAHQCFCLLFLHSEHLKLRRILLLFVDVLHRRSTNVFFWLHKLSFYLNHTHKHTGNAQSDGISFEMIFYGFIDVFSKLEMPLRRITSNFIHNYRISYSRMFCFSNFSLNLETIIRYTKLCRSFEEHFENV